jgi:hypothetical protein
MLQALATTVKQSTRLAAGSHTKTHSYPSYDPSFLRLDFGEQIQAGKYIALSHRWGDLSIEEKETFCTSQDNINQRLRGFSLSDLPKTFQDAVQVK